MSSTTTGKPMNTTAAELCDCLHGGKCRKTGSAISCLCPKGFEGKRCQKSVIAFNSSSEKIGNQELIAGCVVAGFIILILVIVGIVAWRRYRKVQKNKKRRMSLQESYNKKMSIEGISIIDEKAPHKCHSLGCTPPPSYIEVAGEQINGNIYANPALICKAANQEKSEPKVSSNCHDNPSISVDDETKSSD